MNDGTIADIRVTELKTLIDKCQLVLIESEDMKSIGLKLVYKETVA